MDLFAEKALQDITEAVAKRARLRVPRKTGAMSSAISTDAVRKGGVPGEGDDPQAWVGGVSVNHGGAAAIEYGSARRGEPFVAAPSGWDSIPPPDKSVNDPYYNSYYHRNIDIPKHGGRYRGKHPGVRPKPFMRPAINDVCLEGDEAERIFERAFANAYRRVHTSGHGGSVRP